MSVKWQVSVVVDNLVAETAGQPRQAIYNGYAFRPMVTGIGKAMLIEFDYEGTWSPLHRPMVIHQLEHTVVTPNEHMLMSLDENDTAGNDGEIFYTPLQIFRYIQPSDSTSSATASCTTPRCSMISRLRHF